MSGIESVINFYDIWCLLGVSILNRAGARDGTHDVVADGVMELASVTCRTRCDGPSDDGAPTLRTWVSSVEISVRVNPRSG
jgi:hypothetical protein